VRCALARLLAIVTGVLIVLLAVVFALVNASGVGVTAQSDESRLKRGAEVYRAQKCQACHSIAGVGNKRYPLDGVGSRLTEEAIRKWIVAPRDMNPKVSKRAYDKLPKADLDALVAYLASLRKS
jgi:mono/diheme cytochrome c family protein